MFQQDNVRPHIARVTMNIVTQNNMNVLSWSSNSPYLNSMLCGCWKLLPTVNLLYVGRSETLISTPVPGFVHHTFAEENVIRCWTKFGIVSQCLDPQYMTPTNTYTTLYIGQNWSNIRSFWPNNVLAKPVTHCLGGLSPATVIVTVTVGLRRWNRREYRSWLE
jgi:hypothetical protein